MRRQMFRYSTTAMLVVGVGAVAPGTAVPAGARTVSYTIAAAAVGGEECPDAPHGAAVPGGQRGDGARAQRAQ